MGIFKFKGVSYTGNTYCKLGLTCYFQNIWYSQCLTTGMKNSSNKIVNSTNLKIKRPVSQWLAMSIDNNTNWCYYSNCCSMGTMWRFLAC